MMQQVHNSHKLQLTDFVPLGKIGKGSFSQVHKVRNTNDSQIYALKKIKISQLKQKEKQHAFNQIKILSSLSSPYVIECYSSFYDSDTQQLCIVMQWANEGDVHAEIERRKHTGEGKIPESQIWRAIHDILVGLDQIHNKCVLHRDIKSANIFKSAGIYKVGDLNIAKISPTMMACTQTGTPFYASPQVWNEKPYDQKSDIWSLGCVIYQMCQLQQPFVGENMQKLHFLISHAKYRSISINYSEQLDKFIKICLKINPKERLNCKQFLNQEWLIAKLKSYNIKTVQKTSLKKKNALALGKQISKQNQSLNNSVLKQIKNNQNHDNEEMRNSKGSNKKYRMVLKSNGQHGIGYRPKRNLHIKTKQNSRVHTNPTHYISTKQIDQCNISMQKDNMQKSNSKLYNAPESSNRNHHPGLIKKILRPASADMSNSERNYQKYKLPKTGGHRVAQLSSNRINSEQNYSSPALKNEHQHNPYSQQKSYRLKSRQSSNSKNLLLKNNSEKIQNTNYDRVSTLKKLIANKQNKLKEQVLNQQSNIIQKNRKNYVPKIQKPLSVKVHYHSNESVDIKCNNKPNRYDQGEVIKYSEQRIQSAKDKYGGQYRSYILRPYSNYVVNHYNNKSRQIADRNHYMSNLMQKLKK